MIQDVSPSKTFKGFCKVEEFLGFLFHDGNSIPPMSSKRKPSDSNREHVPFLPYGFASNSFGFGGGEARNL